ncbi:MAG: HAD-IA family hydrolase [Clostridia bacterium]|nr:HAD-IA family hydrolase [Clostridia bacterium]
MYNYILFDLDGTLTDPKEGITKCVQYALAACGIDEPNLDNLLSFIGPPLVDEFMRVYGFSKEKAEFALAKYRERFPAKGLYENKIYPGAAQMLAALKQSGRKIALATSKPQPYAEKILEHFKIKDYFDVIVGATFDSKRNDKADVVAEVLKQFGITDADKASVIMVGDRKHDVLGASKNGIKTVGLRLGYAEPGELEEAGAIYIADDIADLENYLLNTK